MDEQQGSAYKLRCALLGHSTDVRGVAAGKLPDGSTSFITSVSRDRTCRVWTPSPDGSFQIAQIKEEQKKYISCVCVVPPTTAYPNGLIVTGGQDHNIVAYEIIGESTSPVAKLVGHKGNVCALAYSPDGLLISGSWDMVAKVWSGQENIETLEGHEQAVWCVAVVPGPHCRILTGSADKEIRLWIDKNTVKTYKGHTDCVRSLTVLDHMRFLSASNDASIRLWNIETEEALHIFYGHTNYIYGIAKFENSEDFVSAGEDRTLRIWRNKDCQQVIHLPGLSVWCVAVMDNGDIVTGSNDGVVRIFTCDSSRVAPPDVLAAFDEEVAATSVNAQQELGGIKVSELPGPEALFKEGKRDGETIMVREGTSVTCYSWSRSDRKWSKVGDVVGASGATPSTSGKQLHEGVEYDYVFNIELDDNRKLKLPYNITEDPWFAAQKFIHKNNLSQLHLDQVANFIVKNSQGMQITATTNSNFYDPFTGGNRYVPGTGTGGTSQQTSNSGVDPFTGSGAYTTGSAPPSSTSSQTAVLRPDFPSQKLLKFRQEVNFEGLSRKLEEFIEKMEATGQSGEIKVCDVSSILEIGRASQWSSDKEFLLQRCLKYWPDEYIFPILDLVRIGVLVPAIAHGVSKAVNVCEQLGRFMKSNNALNQMLAIRILCNMFGTVDDSLIKNRSEIISQVISCPSKDKRYQLSASTLFLNYTSVLAFTSEYAPDHKNETNQSANREMYTEVLIALISLTENLEDAESIYRGLVGIGNIISRDQNTKQLFLSLGGDSMARRYSTSGQDARIKNCANQILNEISNFMQQD